MKRLIGMVFLALYGCAAMPPDAARMTPCDVSQASYECQVYRYLHVND